MSENEVIDLLNFMMHSIQLIQEGFSKINVPYEKNMQPSWMA